MLWLRSLSTAKKNMFCFAKEQLHVLIQGASCYILLEEKEKSNLSIR